VNPDPLFKFDFEKHEYSYAGIVEPSVTQLLQEFGLIDYSAVPRSHLNFKRDLGIGVHYACELLDHHNLDEENLDPRIKPYVDAYKKFCEFTGFEVNSDLTEAKLRSAKWRFCGSPDRQGLHTTSLGSEQVIIDLKATWKMYRCVGPQLRGYKILIEENFKIKIKKVFGLLLSGTGHYDLVPFDDKTDENDFLACVSLHWAKKNKYRKGESNGSYDEYQLIEGSAGVS